MQVRSFVECLNWLALILLVAGIGVYVFKRDAALQYMGQYGLYADGMMLLYAVYSVVAYILVMGVLCVFLEIYASLDQLARASRSSGIAPHRFRERVEPGVEFAE